jgi:enterochelin esterase-like enzyme
MADPLAVLRFTQFFDHEKAAVSFACPAVVLGGPGFAVEVRVFLPAGYDNAAPDVGVMLYTTFRYEKDQPAGAPLPFNVPALEIMRNLIHRGELPMMIGVWTSVGPTLFGEDYMQMVMERLVPQLRARYSRLSSDAQKWGIAGNEQAGATAFDLAWSQSDLFGRVLIDSGDIRCGRPLVAGTDYPAVVKAASLKKLVISMNLGVCTETCDIPRCEVTRKAANFAFAEALQSRGYRFRLLFENAPENESFWRRHFADSMRFLWRDRICD